MTFKPDRWLSILLHPLFMMCYAFLTLYLSASYISFLPDSYKRLLFIALFLNTIIIPIFILMLLKRLGTVKSIELFHHRERVFPIVMVIIPYAVAAYPPSGSGNLYQNCSGRHSGHDYCSNRILLVENKPSHGRYWRRYRIYNCRADSPLLHLLKSASCGCSSIGFISQRQAGKR